MKIEFDPLNIEDRTAVSGIIAALSGVSTPVTVENPEEKTAAPVADENPVAETPTTSDEPDEVDKHNMKWNPEIHSTPATKIADGSWKCKRGGKDALEAAIAEHKQAELAAAGGAMTAPAETPAETGGMPRPGGGMPAPATPTENTPPEPLDFEKVSSRFVALLDKFPGSDVGAIYTDLAINYDTFEVDQAAQERLWRYMDAIDTGADYATAVAVGNAG